MARTVTLLSLRNQVRQRADIENATARFTDAEVNEYINQSWAELYEHIIASCQDYYVSSTNINIVANTTDYALPSDFYKIRGVDVTINSRTQAMECWRFEERDLYRYDDGWYYGSPIAYHRIGNNLKFQPTPKTTYTVTLWYWPAPLRMLSDSDTIDCQAGWEEFIVIDAAIKCLAKDDRDPGAMLQQRAEQLNRAKSMAESQDYGQPDRIVRIRATMMSPFLKRWSQ